jgi:hypothetical protein
MDSTIERGMKTMRESERQLRGLVSEAASAGDYESVMTLTSWARSLATLVASHGSNDQAVVETHEVESSHSVARRGPRGMKVVTRRQRLAKRDYPKFLRRGRDLVKVGWSRRAKAEYEHKVAESVVMLVARAIAKAGLNGELAPTEKFLAAVAAEDGVEVPEYQVYVVLAWLRCLGLVVQRGRQGYTVSQPNDLPNQVSLSWERLPKA